MVDISRKMDERNGIETIVDNDGIWWLNEKHIERLDHKNLQEIAISSRSQKIQKQTSRGTKEISKYNFYRQINHNQRNYGLQNNISS